MIYNSRRWQVLRRDAIQREPYCQRIIEGRPCLAPTTDVDHIVPLEGGGAPWDPANLEALCKRCHSRKTRSETATREV